MKKYKKKNTALIAVISICLIIAVLVAASSIIGHLNKSSITLLPKDDVDEPAAIDNSNYFNDFDSMVLAPNEKNTVYNTDDGVLYLKAGNCGVEDGKLYFEVTTDTYESIAANGLSSTDPYPIIGPQYNVGDYLCIVYDVDVSVDEGYTQEFGIRPDYRTLDGSLSTKNDSLIRFRNGEYIKLYGEEVLATDIPYDYHFTYILWADGSFDVYVDGNLIFECDSAYNIDCAYANGLRFQFKYFTDAETDQRVYFDNMKIKAFDLNYSGAIKDLYKTPDVDLSTNADTVLGGGY